MGNDVTLISSAEETAKDLYRTLAEKNLLRAGDSPVYKFVSTGESAMFTNLARRFLGPEVLHVDSKI
jgi:glutamate racemase